MSTPFVSPVLSIDVCFSNYFMLGMCGRFPKKTLISRNSTFYERTVILRGLCNLSVITAGDIKQSSAPVIHFFQLNRTYVS